MKHAIIKTYTLHYGSKFVNFQTLKLNNHKSAIY